MSDIDTVMKERYKGVRPNSSGFSQYRKDRLECLGHVLNEIPSSGTLLEVGCEPFVITKELHKLKYNVSGVDLFFEDKKLNVKKCNIEIEALPFENCKFDIALLIVVLEYLGKDPIFALNEINRVLKPGGLLVIVTPNFFNINNIKSMILKGVRPNFLELILYGKKVKYFSVPKGMYTKNEMKFILSHCKFKVLGTKFLYNRDTMLITATK